MYFLISFYVFSTLCNYSGSTAERGDDENDSGLTFLKFLSKPDNDEYIQKGYKELMDDDSPAKSFLSVDEIQEKYNEIMDGDAPEEVKSFLSNRVSDFASHMRTQRVRPAKSSCLSPMNTVLLEGGKRITLGNVELGDRVQTLINGKISFTTVIASSHSSKVMDSRFRRVYLRENKWVELTDDHIIFTKTDPINGIQSRQLKIGDSIWSKNIETGNIELENVTAMDEVIRKGYYAPITAEGSLLANDVLVSSYSAAACDGNVWLAGHKALHMLAAPVRLLAYFNLGKVFRTDGSIDDTFNKIVKTMEFIGLAK